MRTKYVTTAGIIAGLLLSGCANKDPIKSFADSAQTLTTSFNLYASSLHSTCQTKYLYMDIDTRGWYDAKTDHSLKSANCTSFEGSEKNLRNLSSVVSIYAASLGKLSGIEGTTFDDNIDTLSGQLVKLNSAAGEKLSEDSIQAANNILKNVAEITTNYFVEQEIKRQLHENNYNLKIVLEEMATFSSRIYRAQLTEIQGQNQILIDQLKILSYIPPYDADPEKNKDIFGQSLVDSIVATNPTLGTSPERKAALSNGSRLPYRMAQIDLIEEQYKIDAQIKTLSKFSDACIAMQKAHQNLMNKFGKLSRSEMLAQLKDFYEKAKEVRDNINTIKS